jgi:hypothetical protein
MSLVPPKRISFVGGVYLMTNETEVETLRQTFPNARFISIATDFVDFADKMKLYNRRNVRIQVSDDGENIKCHHFATADNIEDALDKILTEHIRICYENI